MWACSEGAAETETLSDRDETQAHQGDRGDVPAQLRQALGVQVRDQAQARMHAQGGGRRQEQQLELQGTGHRRGAEPVVERQPQAGQPQAADHLQQQGGDADPLVDLLEGADRLGIAAAQGAGEDAEGQDQVAADPDRGTQQVQEQQVRLMELETVPYLVHFRREQKDRFHRKKH